LVKTISKVGIFKFYNNYLALYLVGTEGFISIFSKVSFLPFKEFMVCGNGKK
jgi:hypothetical protein